MIMYGFIELQMKIRHENQKYFAKYNRCLKRILKPVLINTTNIIKESKLGNYWKTFL